MRMIGETAFRKSIGAGRLFLLFALIVALSGCGAKEIKVPPLISTPPPVTPPPRPAKIALVLGAGASKGFAHIGVLKVLESNKVPIHLIVGTSMGSVVGCLYAYGHNAFELQKMSFSLEKGDVIDYTFPDNGFIKGEKLEAFVNRHLKNTPMEAFKIPFYAVATDLRSGSEIVFGKGNAGAAVRASCAIPGIFRPVRIGDRMYVDGGVVSPVAVEAARRQGADVVIAVDVSSGPEHALPQNTIETILQSISIMYARLASVEVAKADVVIRPRVGHIASGDFSKRHEAILEGEKAALEGLPKIVELLATLKQEGRLE
jgi:NTE family protein